jgi:hypothetical protein
MSHRFSFQNGGPAAAVVCLILLCAAPTRAQKFSNWSVPINLGPAINSGVKQPASGNRERRPEFVLQFGPVRYIREARYLGVTAAQPRRGLGHTSKSRYQHQLRG